LEDDDPALVARLLVYLYGEVYPVGDEGQEVWGNSLGKLFGGDTEVPENSSGSSDQPLSLHAALYGLADKYGCPSLKHDCQQAYIKTLQGDFSLADFISSINVVYETTPEGDDGLRKWAVWVAQGYSDMLQLQPSFKGLIMSRGDFCWDLTTKYQRVNRFWCTSCNESSSSNMSSCSCGNSGICRKTVACETTQIVALRCSNCRTAGRIVPWAAAQTFDSPRQLFVSAVTDDALKRAATKQASSW
jgi:hypothetical protein